jgi:hypothetical protein
MGRLAAQKTVEPEAATLVSSEEVKKKRPPTARQVALWMTFKKEHRLDWQQDYLDRLCQHDSQMAQTYELIEEFTTMLREREGKRLDEWLDRVEKQGIPELQSFAVGLKKDYDAVKAGLTLQWSNGQTEGQVHRLKLLKRQMYGRGSFKLLRKRVLHRAQTKRRLRRSEKRLAGETSWITKQRWDAQRRARSQEGAPERFPMGSLSTSGVFFCRESRKSFSWIWWEHSTRC